METTTLNQPSTDRVEPPERPVPFAEKLRRNRTQLLVAAAFLPVFVGTYFLAYWLRFDGQIGPYQLGLYYGTVTWVVLLKLALFGWFGIHQSWGRFATFYDLVALIKAATCHIILVALVNRLLVPVYDIPRSIFLLDWGATIVVVGGARALLRVLQEYDWLALWSNKAPTFIVGANDAGEALLRAIIRNGTLTYRVVGFIDDNPKRLGARIGGVPVVGTIDQTCQLALRRGVREVLITTGELSGRQIRKLVDDAREHAVRVRVLPSYEQLITGNLNIQPRPVEIDDLLQREPVRLDLANIRGWIDQRVLLVTGSAGSIGSVICRELLRFSPKRIILVDRSETGQFFLERELSKLDSDVQIEVCLADVLDEHRIRGILQQHRPDIIFHAAAYKHVPLMESHPREAVRNIVTATRRLADLAMACKVESFVMISTDKAVNPTSVMGACKRVAELYVQSLAERSPCRFITVRFGNVLDSAGSVVQVFRNQIARGGPVTITDPRMQRYFMTIPEAARLVIQAGAIGGGGEILLLDMGDPVRILDLASDMIRLSGLKVGEDIEIECVGLRPGEKLYEELHVVGERHLPTRHDKITVADCKPCGSDAILTAIKQLECLAEESPDAIVPKLQDIVPEYQRPEHAQPPDRSAAA